MREVFADSVYYIALLNPRDQYHQTAKTALVSVGGTRGPSLVTTTWVLAEVGNVLSGLQVRPKAFHFLQGITSFPSTVVVTDFDPWFLRGLRLYGNRPDKTWSLTDCISFEVMSARGISEALTGDRHFAQAGFTPLLTPASAE